MKQGPKLGHRILNRRSCQQKSIPGVKAEKNLPTATEVVLYCLRLIKNHVVPFYFQQLGLIFRIIYDQIIGGDNDVDIQILVG